MKVFSNTAISLDGHINCAQNKQLFLGSPKDLEMMGVIRSRCDAILIGGNTFRLWPIPSYAPQKKIIWNVIVSRTLDFKLSRKYLTCPYIKPLFLTSRRDIPKTFSAEVLSTKRKITPRWIVAELARRGIKKLLIEGGGDLIYQFLKADLLDEMYVTLCPHIIGDSTAPALVTGAGFLQQKLKSLKLLKATQVQDEIFLHYGVEKA